MRTPRIPLLISLLFFIAFITPVVYLFIGSSRFEVGTSMNFLDEFVRFMTSPNTGNLIVNTFSLALGSALLATVLGVVYTWIVVRTDIPGKSALKLMAILPLTMPFIVKAFAWIYLLSPSIGLINIGIRNIFGVNSGFNIYGLWGMIFAIGTGGLPLVYLTLEPTMKSLDPALEEASRIGGKGILKTVFRVTFPVLLPSILSAFMLLTVMGLENFDYPLILGTPVGFNTLATEVYFWINYAMPPRYSTAAIISMIFIVLTLSSFTLYIWATRRTNKFITVTGKAPRPSIHKLQNWKYPALLFCLVILLLAFFLPFATIILMSVTVFFAPVGGNIVLSFTSANFVNAVSLPLFWEAFRNTIFLGLNTGIIATLIAAFMAYAALKSKTRGARIIEYISSIPLAMPGIVYGLALFWTFLLLPGASRIYGTIWPLVIALVFIRLPHSVRIVSANLMQIADEMEEASRASGASWVRTFWRIVLPLLKGGLFNSFLYTFVNSLRELGSVVLLVTTQSTVLTVLLLELYSNHPLALNTIAAVSVMLTALTFSALAVGNVIQRLLSARSRARLASTFHT
jgi:iron(III) transport system permease protein